MPEYLKIENFAGISSLSIELSWINILIGPQATGKSVCAKLLYFFKSIPDELAESIGRPDALDSRLHDKFKRYFPMAYWPESEFRINYRLNELHFEIVRLKGSPDISIKLPDFYIELLRKFAIETHGKKKKALEKFKTLREPLYTRKQIMEEIASKVHGSSAFNPIFIPAGRSFFALLQRSIFSLLSANKEFDPFILEFGSFYEAFKENLLPSTTSVSSVRNILNGEFIRIDGEDFIKHEDGRRISLSHASSGQQEILPLALLLDIFSGMDLDTGPTVFIEEPEAHIFPSAQRQVIELLAKTFNSRENLQFVITTHSPYIITSLNNLMYAGTLKKKLTGGQLKKLYRIVSKDKIVDPEKVRAYSFGEGTCQTLTDPETGLLLTTVIDEVSHSLSVQFGNLLEADE